MSFFCVVKENFTKKWKYKVVENIQAPQICVKEQYMNKFIHHRWNDLIGGQT